MPTAAFLETAAARLKRRQKISTYALTFPKPAMFKLGARPVIYGLSGPLNKIPEGKGGQARIIPKSILPLREQYRYVTYAPTAGRWSIDWTHEREWRWCMDDDKCITAFEKELEEDGIVEAMKDIPGLELYDRDLSGIGAIVTSKADARKVFHDILFLIDRGDIGGETFEYVLVADDIPNPAAIRDPDQEADAIAAASIDVKTYLAVRDKTIWKRVQAIAKRICRAAPPPAPGETGECWVWLTDSVHKATRALTNEGHVEVNSHGKYLLPVPGIPSTLNLQQKEDIAKAVAAEMTSAFGVEVSYFSTLGSNGSDAVPFYCSDHLDNRLIYNFWSDGLE